MGDRQTDRQRETVRDRQTVRDTETDGERDRESFGVKHCANDKCKAGVYGCADIGFSLSSGSLANGGSWDLRYQSVRNPGQHGHDTATDYLSALRPLPGTNAASYTCGAAVIVC